MVAALYQSCEKTSGETTLSVTPQSLVQLNHVTGWTNWESMLNNTHTQATNTKSQRQNSYGPEFLICLETFVLVGDIFPKLHDDAVFTRRKDWLRREARFNLLPMRRSNEGQRSASDENDSLSSGKWDSRLTTFSGVVRANDEQNQQQTAVAIPLLESFLCKLKWDFTWVASSLFQQVVLQDFRLLFVS